MQHDGRGGWALTTPPVRAGFHYYELIVDGFRSNDPNSETFFGWGQATSGLEVPDPTLDFYEAKAVAAWGGPDDVVSLEDNRKAASRVRLHAARHTNHPLSSHFPSSISSTARARASAPGPLKAASTSSSTTSSPPAAAQPMLVVMDNGYATAAGAVTQPADRAASFGAVIVTDLIPLVDAQFRTLADRDHRAIAGLSMGAMQAIRIGLKHPELFSLDRLVQRHRTQTSIPRVHSMGHWLTPPRSMPTGDSSGSGRGKQRERGWPHRLP